MEPEVGGGVAEAEGGAQVLVVVAVEVLLPVLRNHHHSHRKAWPGLVQALVVVEQDPSFITGTKCFCSGGTLLISYLDLLISRVH